MCGVNTAVLGWSLNGPPLPEKKDNFELKFEEGNHVSIQTRQFQA